MKSEWYNFSESLGYLTIVASRLFMSYTNRQITKLGLDLTAEQWGILRMLLNEDGLTQETLLRMSRYEKSTLSRLLDGMEKKGLVERRRDKADGRRKSVFITPKGVEYGEIGTEINLKGLEELYAGIPVAELNICRDTIELIQERLLRMGREEE